MQAVFISFIQVEMFYMLLIWKKLQIKNTNASFVSTVHEGRSLAQGLVPHMCQVLFLIVVFGLSRWIVWTVSCEWGGSLSSSNDRGSWTPPLCTSRATGRTVRWVVIIVLPLTSTLRPVHTGTNIGARYSLAFFNAFFVFTLKRFSLTMSRVNMQIHSLTLDGA